MRQLGMVGLGRMGASMAHRVSDAGHQCVAYDLDTAVVAELARSNIVGAATLEDLTARLSPRRAIWIMVPASATVDVIAKLAPHLAVGDILIDGGNSHYRDAPRRSRELVSRGVHYVDVGTSGGVAGAERGYCLMIGGEPEIVEYLSPLFAALAPGAAGKSGEPIQNAARDVGRTAAAGYLHCGPSGAGHFVKMVHNGIEYGLMAAYAEGMNILRHANAGKHQREGDAETAPLRSSEAYRYDLDLPKIAEVWRHGSIIDSSLLGFIAGALKEDAELENFAGHVSDSGEGRWTMKAAIDEGVPAPTIGAALSSRFQSRGNADYANRLLSAMRKQFGGHDEKPRPGV